jgi:hypothetical protein
MGHERGEGLQNLQYVSLLILLMCIGASAAVQAWQLPVVIFAFLACSCCVSVPPLFCQHNANRW